MKYGEPRVELRVRRQFFFLFFFFALLLLLFLLPRFQCFRKNLHVKHGQNRDWEKKNQIFVAILHGQHILLVAHVFSIIFARIGTLLQSTAYIYKHIHCRYMLLHSFLILHSTNYGCDSCPVCFCFMQLVRASVIAPYVTVHISSIWLSLSVSDGLVSFTFI